MSKKVTTEEFIRRSELVHGKKYDYDKSDVNGTHNKVVIVCHEKDKNGIEHGEFLQTPKDHMHGQGCPKCGVNKVWNTRGRLTVEEVRKKFESVHNDKYDYSLFTEYNNNRTKIPVICKEHGVFYVTPNNHLRGRGCPICKSSKISYERRLQNEEVISRIKSIHGDKYVIPNDLNYKNNQDKIKLICPVHGEFFQNPFNLWRGVGCPKCNKSKLENRVSLILDKNSIRYEEQKKFEWLKNYELDFYLPDYNVAIECQGIQHFESIELFGGKVQLEIQNKWDEEKNRLCGENGIKVLYYTTPKLKEKNSNYKYPLITEENILLDCIVE